MRTFNSILPISEVKSFTTTLIIFKLDCTQIVSQSQITYEIYKITDKNYIQIKNKDSEIVQNGKGVYSGESEGSNFGEDR